MCVCVCAAGGGGAVGGAPACPARQMCDRAIVFPLSSSADDTFCPDAGVPWNWFWTGSATLGTPAAAFVSRFRCDVCIGGCV